MPAPQATSPAEIRRMVLVQLALTTAFLVVVFVLLDGLDADRPPWWLLALPIVVVAAGAALAERAWLRVPPLAAETRDPEQAALDAFVAQTTRKLVCCEGALLVCAVLAFISDRAGWLVLVAGVPGVLVLAFEIWPSARNLSLTEAMLDANGVRSGLLETFEDAR
jgi:hypothetical protein